MKDLRSWLGDERGFVLMKAGVHKVLCLRMFGTRRQLPACTIRKLKRNPLPSKSGEKSRRWHAAPARKGNARHFCVELKMSRQKLWGLEGILWNTLDDKFLKQV